MPFEHQLEHVYKQNHVQSQHRPKKNNKWAFVCTKLHRILSMTHIGVRSLHSTWENCYKGNGKDLTQHDYDICLLLIFKLLLEGKDLEFWFWLWWRLQGLFFLHTCRHS